MMRLLTFVTFLLLTCGSLAQNRVEQVSFFPGSSTLNSHDGLVLANFLSNSNSMRGLICDNQRNIDPAGFCYALGYAAKGIKYIWQKKLQDLTNVPSQQLNAVTCTRGATDALYLRYCSFSVVNSCPNDQLLALQCVEPRAVSSAAPATLPTLPPVNCSTGASKSVRLLDSSNKAVITSGRLEILTGGNKWQSVCNYDFQNKEARFICDLLCSSGANPKAISGPNDGKVAPGILLSCPASATDFNGCKQTTVASQPQNVKQQCTEKNAAYVFCTPPTSAPPVSFQPVADVSCNDNLATVTFNKSLNSGLKTSSLMLVNSGTRDSGCFFNVTDTGDEIVVIFTFSLCGGSLEYNANATIFKNSFLRIFEPVNGLLMETNVTFGVYCTLKKEVDVNKGDLSGQAVTAKPLGGTDQPSVTLQLFLDEQMTKELTPGREIPLNPNTRVYAKLTEKSNIASTRMAVRQCWLTPTADRNSATRQFLIVDGCRHPTLVKQVTHVDDMTETFEFQPVLFPGHKAFHLHCNTKTCAKTDSSQACSRSCTNNNPSFTGKRRRKRSADFEKFVRELLRRGWIKNEHQIDSGPYYITRGPTTDANVLHTSFLLVLSAFLVAFF